ncbi:MAG: ABC transporter permease [Firmicutes bacterium]|nr:ABC transporter permease [Bacillota bacterium]
MKKNKPKTRMSYKFLFALPFFIFMIMMVVVPLSLLFFYAFFEDGSFTFAHIQYFFTDSVSVRILFRSLGIALLATVIAILIAFPIALGLATAGFKRSHTILMLFIMPMWINLLLRSFALRELFGIIGVERGLFALVFAIVLDYLPLAIIPIYVVISGTSKKYIEASQDLGANPTQVFTKTILPLSVPGIMAAFLLVFTPAISTYFLVQYFGDNSTRMLGWLLFQLNINSEFGRASVISIALLIIVVLTILITNRLSKRGNKRGGLW